jgi:hypothetical protein
MLSFAFMMPGKRSLRTGNREFMVDASRQRGRLAYMAVRISVNIETTCALKAADR